MRLARPVGAEDGHALAVPDLEVEGLHQAGELEVGADDGALAGATALEPHRHLLLARLLDRRTGLLELLQPRLGGAVLRRHAVVVLRLDLEPQHERLDLGVLLVPAAPHLLEALEAVAARRVIAREAARVRPHEVARAAELDGDDAGRGVVEQLAVVADEEDRLGRLADASLEPDLAGHVEVVVGLVEQQHLVGTAQEVLQHQPLLLAARQRAEQAVARAVEGQAHRRGRAHVPRHLDVVAAGVGVVGERRGVGHLGLLVVGVHQRELGRVDRRGSGTHALGRDRQQQVVDGLVAAAVPDELPHHAEPTGARDDAGVGREVAGHDPQQRRLAGAVGAHERDLLPVADPEADVVEQHPPVRQLVTHSSDIHVTHEEDCPLSYALASRGYPWAPAHSLRWLRCERSEPRNHAPARWLRCERSEPRNHAPLGG